MRVLIASRMQPLYVGSTSIVPNVAHEIGRAREHGRPCLLLWMNCWPAGHAPVHEELARLIDDYPLGGIIELKTAKTTGTTAIRQWCARKGVTPAGFDLVGVCAQASLLPLACRLSVQVPDVTLRAHACNSNDGSPWSHVFPGAQSNIRLDQRRYRLASSE